MATILVVEDEPPIRELLTELLLDEGYDVLSAPDGIAALEILAGRLPDLLITDAMMPGLDGSGLVRRMRADPRTAAVPVLLISAVPRPASVDLDGVGFLPKPFDLDRLLREIEARLGVPEAPPVG